MPFSYGETAVSPPDLRQLLSQPKCPIPIQFLKGQPVFWDDFETGPAGFISQDKAAPNVGSAIVGAGVGRNWTWSDGNEYSAYVTNEASYRGSRSLRLGGSIGTYVTDAIDILQDASTSVHIPSGIVGIEYAFSLGNMPTNGSSLMTSCERSIILNSTQDKYQEMWLYIQPKSNTGVACNILMGPTGTAVLTSANAGSPVPDSNGNFLPNNLTAPTSAGSKGAGAAWHKAAFTYNMNVPKILDFYLDGYYLNCRSIGANVPREATYTHSNKPSYQELGLFRCEVHNSDSGAGAALYVDDFVVTDEAGFVSL